MKNRLKKVLNIIRLTVLVILCHHNLSYAGNIGDSPDAWKIVAIMFSPLIFILFICLFAASRESSLKQQKKIDIRTTKRENIEKPYSIGEVVYAAIIILIMCLMFFNRNFLLILNAIIALSIVLLVVFLYYIYIDKKQEKLGQESKTINVSKEKVEKNITKLRNNVYLTNFMITCLGLLENVEPILLLLLVFIPLSIVIVMQSSKKIATVIGFISLIVSISIILHYSVLI